jgi:hypothetical protein
MWTLIKEHSAYGITAKSYKTENDQIEDDFAVAIFFSSYESRGLTAAECLRAKSCETSISVFFKETDDQGLRIEYDQQLRDRVRACSIGEPLEVVGKSITNIDDILAEILGRIPSDAISRDRRWLIDTSVSPKPYFLGLLGYLRHKLVRPKLTLFNSTAHYEKNLNPAVAFSFTEGFENYLLVPWLWGRPDPRLPWTYVFLLGFEGDRSYATYDKFEPEFVKALISDPGYMPGYKEQALDRNSQFLTEACPDIVFSDAADPVETWIKIDEMIAQMPNKTNFCIIPLGTKPHSIGAALSALENNLPSVLYLMPKSYKVRDVPRGRFIWRYEIVL